MNPFFQLLALVSLVQAAHLRSSCNEIQAACPLNMVCSYHSADEYYKCTCRNGAFCDFEATDILGFGPDRDFFPELERFEHHYICQTRSGESVSLDGNGVLNADDMVEMYLGVV